MTKKGPVSIGQFFMASGGNTLKFRNLWVLALFTEEKPSKPSSLSLLSLLNCVL